MGSVKIRRASRQREEQMPNIKTRKGLVYFRNTKRKPVWLQHGFVVGVAEPDELKVREEMGTPC